MSLVIEAAGLSKAYNLGEAGFYRPSRWFGRRQQFWALRDVSFEIREHEAVGIVGANGAGKSTLLKILSRVTAPTSGKARVRGRMGTILEVGTGFHPELTGRENIYLSGTILGMPKEDIRRRFDEIIQFAAVESFVDTPVKRYSSGMYVRLAFAVAAHLNPDILIVDEVLAVGDVSFQKKCLAKMDSSMQQEGRTIIFVSHNMQAIRSLCTRALLLKEGRLIADGSVGDILRRYASEQTSSLDLRNRAIGNRLNRTRGHARILNVAMSAPDVKDHDAWSFLTGEAVELKITYDIVQPVQSLAVLISFVAAGSGDIVTSIRHVARANAADTGESGEMTILIPKLPLRPGEYALTIALADREFGIFEDVVDANVDLPHLVVESAETGLDAGGGWFAMDYICRHSETNVLHSEEQRIGAAP
ncbi:MAG TPA: ABC transporter ATP-binding protein [Candidatus Acidoferrales bacterium]|nr:ABC transporter ATP-binding protein [Candidatus Acidoferrales bacterium]